ncbi:MAG: glycosyltransferase family 39 protein [Candidatus Limimorpha sp.]
MKMTNQKLSGYDRIILWIILLLSAVLRLCNLDAVPFMHDEFSALSRTCYDNFHDLIREGVMLNDSHPAGVQVFLYLMVKVFGWNEFWLKLPFALLGVASVYLVFVVARQWFNKNVALLSAAFFSVSELFVFYSQLIRPYSPGLFFVLLLVFFWNKMLSPDAKFSVGTCAGFALSAFCAAEIQMFSMMQAGIIAIAGLFSLNKLEKKRRYAYLISCLCAVLLFLPSLPVFYYQIFVYGSIGGWLSAPQQSFLFDFLSYSMNYSKLFMFCMLVVVLLPIVLGCKKQGGKLGIRLFCLISFAIPFIIAFVYSLLKEPILQFSTLIFSFPFLIILALSFYDENVSKTAMTVVTACVLFVGLSSLIIDRQYYRQVNHQGFDQIAEEMKIDKGKYSDSICLVSYADRAFMNEFYQEKAGLENAICFSENDAIIDYQRYLKNRGEDYLGAGLADHAEMSWELSAVAEYPYLVKEKTWFTTRYLTLSKTDNGNPLLREIASGVAISKGTEWACSRSIPVDSITEDTGRFGVIADVTACDTLNNLLLVVHITDPENDSTILWRSFECKDSAILPGDNMLLTCGFFVPEIDFSDKRIRTYLWNMEKKELFVNKMAYYKGKKNPFFYGLYNPI